MRFLFLVFMLFCILIPTAHAAEKTLPTLIVSASAEPSAARTLPTTVQVVDRGQIEKSRAKTLSDLLKRTTATRVLVQPGNYTNFSLRGFRSGKSSNVLGDGVILLIDGHRAGTNNLDNIPLAGVERVEVLRGSASVLYGGSAVGGIINVITTQGKGAWTGRINTEYGSWDKRAIKANTSAASKDDRFGISLAFGASASSDYEDGNGNKYENTAYNKAGGIFTASFRPASSTNFSGTGIVNKVYSTGSPGYMPDLTPDDSVTNDYQHGALAFEHLLDNNARVSASLYASENIYDYIARGGWTPGNSVYDDKMLGAKSIGSMPIQVGQMDWGRISVGAEALAYEQDLRGSSIWSPNSSTDVLSVFAEHKLDMENLSVVYGIRYDYYDFSTSANTLMTPTGSGRTFEQATWSAGATYWVQDWLGLRINTGTAYVPPTAMQLVANYHTGYTIYRANPDLNAERSLSSSAGVEVDYDGLAISLAYFHTRYKDRIVTEFSGSWPNSYADYYNSGNMNISGIEGQFAYTHEIKAGEELVTLAPYASWEIMTSRTNPEHTGIRRTQLDVPRYTALAGLGVGYDIYWLDVNVQMVGSHVGNDFSNGSYTEYSKFEGFEIWNARLGATPFENLEVYLQVDNITDKYYGYKPEYPMPGRSLTVGCSWTF